MPQPAIAMIFDCDDTLTPDTISYVLKEHDLEPLEFWDQIKRMVKRGWDPPHAYMNTLLELDQNGKVDLSKDSLSSLGKRLPLFPGLPGALDELRTVVRQDKVLGPARVSLEYYIISGGLEEVILATPLAAYMAGIWGCTLDYDVESGRPRAVKATVTFTEKTRYLYAIHKGVAPRARIDPYEVNDWIPQNDRPIPFVNMLYLGDGASDVPCLSVILNGGGTTVGVSPPDGAFDKGYEMARGNRLKTGPYTAIYSAGSDLRKTLERAIHVVGNDIVEEERRRRIGTPRY